MEEERKKERVRNITIVLASVVIIGLIVSLIFLIGSCAGPSEAPTDTPTTFPTYTPFYTPFTRTETVSSTLILEPTIVDTAVATNTGTITGDVWLLDGSGPTASTFAAALLRGSTVTILDEADGRYLVQFKQNDAIVVGWISSQYVYIGEIE